jgi:hypothetical protein
MSIDSKHPDYKAHIERWSLVRSVVDNDASRFIRTVDANDTSRSASYKEGAILTNFTSLTKEGLTGLVMRRDPAIEIPTTIEYLKEDATGDGRGLIQLAKQSLGEVMTTGRSGYLVDYPRRTGGTSIRDTEELKARILLYRAENIINWNIERINNKAVVKFIVLHEPTLELIEDGFEWELKDKYRLLKLDDEGNYYQALYDENFDIVDFVYPTDNNGNNLKEIPFTFVGAADNNEDIDKAPLYDLSVLNIGHYRNSADYEESVFVVGQPTIFVSGSWGIEEFKEALPQGIKFGSRAGYFLGEGGNATLVQANPNQLADEAMKSKLKQAAYIGARLIAEPGGRETAEAARLRFSSQNSALHTIVLNVDDALTKCMEFCILFMGGNKEAIDFKLNRQFYDETADPQMMLALINAFQNGLMTLEEARNELKQRNVLDVDKSMEEFNNELADQDPFVTDTGNNNANDNGQID